MVKKNPMIRNVLLGFAGVSFLLLLMIILRIQLPLSVTETSCSGDTVWLKYTLADEGSQLSRLIADCAANPAGGWVGDIKVTAKSMTGRVTTLGGYEASSASTQKINCGVSSQTGKTFFGNYVPNDGMGVYQIIATGHYYLKSENYGIPHEFTITDNAPAYCILPSSTCPDGTALQTCSSNQPKYCGSDAVLYDNAPKCGCPSGYQAKVNWCNPIPTETQETTVVPSPYTQNVTTTAPVSGEGVPANVSSAGTTPSPTPANPVTNEINYFGLSATTLAIILGIIILLVAILFYFKVI